MDEKKICFIVAVNDQRKMQECMRYINSLIVPDGYLTDIITICEAESMAEAYQTGMEESDAKYKIYLHQDVFIINPTFMQDVIGIFNADTQIGMIGFSGIDFIPEDGIFEKKWNTGTIIEYTDNKTELISEKYAYIWDDFQKDFSPKISMEKYEKMESSINIYIRKVVAVQGCCMVTDVDIPWMQNNINEWDYVDIAHAFEMYRENYCVVVPYQNAAWCYHDRNAVVRPDSSYARGKMVGAYPELFSGGENEEEFEQEYQNLLAEKRQVDSIREQIAGAYDIGEYDTIRNLITDLIAGNVADREIWEIIAVLEVKWLEENNQSIHSDDFFIRGELWKNTYARYIEIRYTLLRMKYGIKDKETDKLKKEIQDGSISKDIIRKIEEISFVNLESAECLNDEDLVSVLLPVYNGEKTIGDTLKSIVSQSYKNIEIIVIDDASTDQSRNIIDQFAVEDSRIKRVYLTENRNVCNAGNIGFAKAKGKYVALIGHDDIWRKNKLKRQILFMKEHPAIALCFTWAEVINAEKICVTQKNGMLKSMFQRSNMTWQKNMLNLIVNGNFFCSPSACIRSDVLQKVGYYRYGLVQLQDYDLWLRILETEVSYVMTERTTLYRRFDDNSNLSASDIYTDNRTRHEGQWIKYHLFKNFDKEKFKYIMQDVLCNPNAVSEKEIEIEKALILWQQGDCFAEDLFIELLEDEEVRNILEEKYHFTLQDFYKKNKEPIEFDAFWKNAKLVKE